MIVDKIADKAASLYVNGMSLDAVALEVGIAYRTARKAVQSTGVELRSPSERLLGRTRPDKKSPTTTADLRPRTGSEYDEPLVSGNTL